LEVDELDPELDIGRVVSQAPVVLQPSTLHLIVLENFFLFSLETAHSFHPILSGLVIDPQWIVPAHVLVLQFHLDHRGVTGKVKIRLHKVSFQFIRASFDTIFGYAPHTLCFKEFLQISLGVKAWVFQDSSYHPPLGLTT